ncbi:hypothetical protein IIC38_10970 [candidate division KSB1 bacterium]|nr:hypothetical protein [candidate division KSB1 bacterium]
MKSLNITILLTLVFISTNCPSTTIDDSLKGKATGKIKGVIFDGPGEPPITEEMVENILPSNAKWIAVIPEAFTYRNTLKVKSFLRTGGSGMVRPSRVVLKWCVLPKSWDLK